MIFIAGLDIASRQIFHLDLGDFANLRLGDRADLVGQRFSVPFSTPAAFFSRAAAAGS